MHRELTQASRDAALAEPGDGLIGHLVGGRYRVIAKLGVGGMGVVYRVEHVVMNRPFAMKVVHHQLDDDEEVVERFRREASAGGRLTHPNCVAIHDFGVLQSGSFYLTMELVRGRSLGDGMTIGTPEYMAPEQALGGELDGRADLYALSIVLYEMLVGTTPFDDPDPLQILNAHTTANVPRFAQVAPEVVVPSGVEALVRHGLEKRPADRIASAAEYTARINQLLRVTPAPAPTPPAGAGVLAWHRNGQSGVALDRPSRRIAGWLAVAFVGLGIVAAVAPGRDGQGAPVVPAATRFAISRQDWLARLTTELVDGRTCIARRTAVGELRALGDKRAIPALRRARYRMRGGVFGVGESNTNACLTAAADATIAELSRLPDPPDGGTAP